MSCSMSGAELTPFLVDVPEAELEDLRVRLGRTRWAEPETVADWSQGVPVAYLRDLCEYWREDYDWRRTQARLNAIPQFRTEIDGVRIHFLHARSPHPDALPLLITHGWPGSVVEFLDVIGPLVDPPRYGGSAADAFDVVCPSLPGYGFSDKPDRPGWGTRRIAAAWSELMARLGYDRYGAQGGDWGSIVTLRLAEQDAGRLAASTSTRCWSLERTWRGSSPRTSGLHSPISGSIAGGTLVTQSSKRHARRHSATGLWTRRSPNVRGSSRSYGPGLTATATPRTSSPVTRSSTT